MTRICLAPTQRTNRLATALLQQARRTSGADAVAAFHGDIEAEQLLALVGVLLNRAVRDGKPEPIRKGRMGPPLKPLTLSDETRERLLKRFFAGDTSPEARLAHAEHRRIRRNGELARR